MRIYASSLLLLLAVVVSPALSLAAPAPRFQKQFSIARPNANIRGGAILPTGRLLTWGRELLEWNLETRQVRKLASGPFEAGCISADGTTGAFQLPNGNLIARRAPDWNRAEFIDNNVQLSDCLWTPILGQPGLLMIHRNAQVRHYRPPNTPTAKTRWPYREIYSIYTASRQTGLALSDIDNDGNPDIFCGNYWIQSPSAYDLPWRLFAINPYYTEPDSATVALAPVWGGLVVAQRERPNPIVSLFVPGTERTQLWTEHKLPVQLQRPRSVLPFAEGLLLAEDNGPASRVVFFASPKAMPTIVAAGPGSVQLIPAKAGFVQLCRTEVNLWRPE